MDIIITEGESMSDIRTERCEALRPLLLESLGLIPRLLGSADVLPRFLDVVDGILAVHALGDAGIEDPLYRHWIATGGPSLRRLRDAAAAGDRRATIAAFQGQDGAMFPIGQGCSGAPGY